MLTFRPVVYALSALFVLLALTIHAAWPDIHASLQGAKLIPAEEPLTELYFNDIESLPQTAARPLSFSFTIHNLEGKDMTYPYAVSAEFPDGRVVVLDRTTILIADGDAVRIPETLRPTQSGSSRIIVEIPGRHISFLLK